MPTSPSKTPDMREEFLRILKHFEHILPAQASIRDFVHHNTLHGFEHLKFQEAMKVSNELTGAYGYWPREKFQQAYLEGRLNDEDLNSVLLRDEELSANDLLFEAKGKYPVSIYKKDVYRAALLFPLKPLSSCQLKWEIDEADALELMQKDVPESSKQAVLARARVRGLHIEADVVNDLWEACVKTLGLDPRLFHAEDLLDLSREQAEKMFGLLKSALAINSSPEGSQEQKQKEAAWVKLESVIRQSRHKNDLRDLVKTLTGVEVQDEVVDHGRSKISLLVRKDAWHQLDKLIEKVGDDISLRTLLLRITGIDVQDDILHYLQRYLASWLDEGLAAWHVKDRKIGFYKAWKESALEDEYGAINDIPEWREYIESLPDDSVDTILAELARMGIPQDKWSSYIERIALDLPGWSGMFFWRHQNPDYDGHTEVDVNMMDYLAVRLVLEHIFIRRLCRQLWLFGGNLSTIRGYFRDQHAEFLVRNTLYNAHLPEYLITLSQQLIERDSTKTHKKSEWRTLAHMIWTWQQSPAADTTTELHLHCDGWRLFRLAQHLGLSGGDVCQLKQAQLDEIFACVDAMEPEKAGFLSLQAYEQHYRNKIFSAVQQNQGRGTWAARDERPEGQVIFCMDDREEGFRRHLEHLNPRIETFGAAAFFGVVMNWQSLEDNKPLALCPVVATPVHEVKEVAAKGHEAAIEAYEKHYALRTQIRDAIHQETRRGLVAATALMIANAPSTALILMGKAFAPLGFNRWVNTLKKTFDGHKRTRITYSASETLEDRDATNHQTGFTLDEQANIVEGFLQNNGLLSDFAPLVVMMGHYSRNQNNPHAAAYGCGACGGKFSGPNARVFASMANEPKVRAILAARGIKIPVDTWFLCAEHDTCNEQVIWEDLDLLPGLFNRKYKKLNNEIQRASAFSAHERCRKFASAPKKPSIARAIKHIAGRAVDYSQARPELGHATIAVGFVGRRHLSQGLFMDRRCFLISYDANVDPDGAFLERILLSAGPVGAGINLEYYFSSVNNAKYGSGSKVVHNLSGLFGVMEGANSDLRTGLPQQMIEIHEPMRLQLVVEATTEALTDIYKRQPSIQQLVGNGWLLLSAKDPTSKVISTFDPERGWEVWEDLESPLPMVDQSSDWYEGKYGHLNPVLIKQVKKTQQNGVTNG